MSRTYGLLGVHAAEAFIVQDCDASQRHASRAFYVANCAPCLHRCHPSVLCASKYPIVATHA
eukprot:scaffold17_cov354-Pavlova_lutheri.AAC.58